MNNLKERSEWIDFAKFFSIFAVVILHSAASVLSHSEFNTYDWWVANVIDASVRWAVPVFVMITGVLLINGTTDYISNFKKIPFRLLVPFVCWLVVYFFWNYIKSNMKGELDSFDYFGDVLHGVPHYHLWYMYMITGIYMLLIAFRKGLQDFSNLALGVFTGITMLISAISVFLPSDINFQALFWCVKYLPYCFLGYYIFRVTVTISIYWLIIMWLIIVALIALLTAFFIDNSSVPGMYFYNSFNPLVIILSSVTLLIFKKYNKESLSEMINDKVKNYSKLTLGIYLVHPIFLESINFIGYGTRYTNSLLMIPITSVIVFILSLTFCVCISKIRFIKAMI